MVEALTERLQQEIEDVHAFIAAWFRGDIENSDAVFDAGLAGKLADGFVNIQPSGQLLSRGDLVDGLRAGHGGNADFRIEISEVVLRHAWGDHALVTYVELQSGAKNTVPADNLRVSTVLFSGIRDGEQLTWMHIHETGFV